MLAGGTWSVQKMFLLGRRSHASQSESSCVPDGMCTLDNQFEGLLCMSSAIV